MSHRVVTGSLIAALALAVVACSESAPSGGATTGARRVFFVSPKNGDTIKSMSTIEFGSSGVTVGAVPPGELKPEQVRANIGFMSSNTGIYDRMTAWELVEYYGRLYGMNEDVLQERLDDIFATLQMNEIRDVLGSKMSTGMKQKVSIARTIVHDPPVLIFDEPTSGLDVLVARAVLNTIAKLKDEGKCIIFSTHIMREVEKLCDRLGVIHRGRILALGTLEELAETHHQPDVEELFFDLIMKNDQSVRMELAG